MAITAERLFIVLEVARGKMPQQEFARFLATYDVQISTLLAPYGYKGCRVTEQATLQDFDGARAEWMKRTRAASQQVAAGPGNIPMDDEAAARKRMWEAAANDPIAAVVIGLGAIIAATLGQVIGFEQDPAKAAAAGKTISTIVTSVGTLNNPHQLNEMLRDARAVKDKIKIVEGKNIRNGGTSYGTRNPNSGAPSVNNKNCGQCTGGVLEGMGGTSTSFATRASFPEGLTPTPLSLASQFQVAGNHTGPIKQSNSMGDLFLQLMQYPVGTNVALLYKNPDGRSGHVICAFVGKGKELMFVDAQMKPPQVISGPVTGSSDFYFFAVTPKQR